MTDSVKVGFVGTGDVFLKYYLPEVMRQDVIEITAICDSAGDRAKQAADFLGGIESYNDYQDMLANSDAELVVIVTPPMSHFPLALAGLQAGKHVYVEKPFCRRLEEANQLVETARSQGVQLMAAPSIMLDPSVDVIRGLLAEGSIGKVAYANVSSNGVGDAEPGYYERFLRMTAEAGIDVLRRPDEKTDPAWYFQEGGGPLYDVGVYSITRITGLLGPARRVVAMSGVVDPHRVVLKGTDQVKQIDVTEDDLTLILLDMGDSRFVHINTGWIGGVGRGQPPGIVGMEGTIAESEGMVHLYRNDSEKWTDYPVVGNAWSIPSGLVHLAECIVSGGQPKITIEHARHVVEIMEKTCVAARTGEAQEITTTF